MPSVWRALADAAKTSWTHLVILLVFALFTAGLRLVVEGDWSRLARFVVYIGAFVSAAFAVRLLQQRFFKHSK